jgi:hypothetical protein
MNENAAFKASAAFFRFASSAITIWTHAWSSRVTRAPKLLTSIHREFFRAYLFFYCEISALAVFAARDIQTKARRVC